VKLALVVKRFATEVTMCARCADNRAGDCGIGVCTWHCVGR